jgi:hypothetical protein
MNANHLHTTPALPITPRLTSFGQVCEPDAPPSSTIDDVTEFLGQSVGTFTHIEPHVQALDFSAPVFRCALTTLRAADQAFEAGQHDEADRLLDIAIGAFQATYDDAPSLGSLYAPFRAALHVAYCARQALGELLARRNDEPPGTADGTAGPGTEGQP